MYKQFYSAKFEQLQASVSKNLIDLGMVPLEAGVYSHDIVELWYNTLHAVEPTEEGVPLSVDMLPMHIFPTVLIEEGFAELSIIKRSQILEAWYITRGEIFHELLKPFMEEDGDISKAMVLSFCDTLHIAPDEEMEEGVSLRLFANYDTALKYDL